MVRRFVRRHQAPTRASYPAKAAIASAIGIGLIAWLGNVTGAPLIVAPFGATCVLLFSVPESPMSQPANVVGGYLLAALISMGMDHVLPDVWWAMPIAMGCVIAAMTISRLTHPPAGAVPLVILSLHPGISFIVLPLLTGTIALVGVATFLHRLPPRLHHYPLPVHPKK
jgi:CBS-domain-containing membrane protein